VGSTRARKHDFVGLGPLGREEDHVLLQYVVLLERLISGFKGMDSEDGRMGKQEFAEGQEVGTIAEAAGSDRDKLATWSEEVDGERNKRGIEIGGFYASAAEQLAMEGAGLNLLVGWIQYYVGVGRRGSKGRKEARAEARSGILDEIKLSGVGVEVQAGRNDDAMAFFEGLLEVRNKGSVDFVAGDGDRVRSAGAFA